MTLDACRTIYQQTEEFNGICNKSHEKKTRHHDETRAAQKDFITKVHQLEAAVTGMGNSFDTAGHIEVIRKWRTTI